MRKRATAILTSDMHLRMSKPEARTDDFFAAQGKKLKFISDLQREHDCPVLDAGDMFNSWKPGEFMLQWAINNLPSGRIITIPGNHDMPNHNIALYEKSGLAVLEAAGNIIVLKPGTAFSTDWWPDDKNIAVHGFAYGENISEPIGLIASKKREDIKTVAIVHTYVAETVPPFITDGYTPKQLLEALPGYDLILSGHNHAPLVYEYRGCLVVNPGSLMRMFADQADMKPRVYLWFAEDNTVTSVYLPIEAGVVSREHIDRAKERDGRMEAFVSRLKGNVDMSLSFENNIEQYMQRNRIDKEVREMVREAINAK